MGAIRRFTFGRNQNVIQGITTTPINIAFSGYSNSTLAPNGKLYFAPGGQDRILEFDPITNAFQKVGQVLAGGTIEDKYIGSALAPNGNIYFSPSNANQILELNPNTLNTQLVGVNLGAGGYKYSSITLAENGKMYLGGLSGANEILEFNPNTYATQSFGYTGGSFNYIGGRLATNGKIYLAPFFANQILEIDTNTLTTQLVGQSLSGSFKYQNVKLARNGNLYFTPRNATQVLELNTAIMTTQLVGSTDIAGGKYISGEIGLNGKLYLSPFSGSQKVLEFDTNTYASQQVGGNYNGYGGAKLAPNGNIYLSPTLVSNILKIEGTNTPNVMGADAILPTDLSTLATSNYNKYYN